MLEKFKTVWYNRGRNKIIRLFSLLNFKEEEYNNEKNNRI
jgi:hypothetical protein